jgi:hypothetical protein
MPVNWIVLHIQEPYRYSMTAALFGETNNNVFGVSSWFAVHASASKA